MLQSQIPPRPRSYAFPLRRANGSLREIPALDTVSLQTGLALDIAMNRDTDLIFAVLALEQGLLAPDPILACASAWARETTRRLPDLLEEAGALDEETRATLEALVASRMRDEEEAGGSLESLLAGEDLEDSLLALAPGENEPGDGTGEKTVPRPTASRRLPTRAGERYRPGPEIGRGALGRVFKAVDTVLGREVAVKEMLHGTGSFKLLERFLREGEIAGRLSHPNVIPVHDIGVREDSDPPDGASRQVPYFVMTRIEGRDLSEILRAVKRGSWERVENVRDGRPCTGRAAPDASSDPRKEFSRPRLLRIFQDVCLAMAYAHDRGVIHRDLKPANVMVGEYGEVYVVDWGLAKVQIKPDAPDSSGSAGTPAGSSDVRGTPAGETPSSRETVKLDAEAGGAVSDPADQAPQLTLEGDILGTPAYMPPEQAEGRLEDVDERSDLYSLGAILYEILAFRPPFEGASGAHVLAQVVQGNVTPPSRKSSMMWLRRKDDDDTQQTLPPGTPEDLPAFPSPPAGTAGLAQEGPRFVPDPVPPELEEVVMRSMARDPGKRFASAREVHDEIQKYLEGEKERERNRKRAEEKMAEGRKLVEGLERLRAERKTKEEEAERAKESIRPFWPAEKKKAYWKLLDEVETLHRDVVKTFGRAAASFQEALGFVRDHPGARASLADLYWDQYLREEEAGDKGQMVYFENLVREYNDGQYDEKLKGDGTLAVATRHFPCRCMLDGRMVAPQELGGSVECGVSSVEKTGKDTEDSRSRLPDRSAGGGRRLALHVRGAGQDPRSLQARAA